VNKYQTPVVEELVQELERAYDVQKEGKARGMQLIFAKFDSMRHLWAAAAQATAMLDALGSLAQASSKAGYTRPTILDCPPDGKPYVCVVQGKHACVDTTHSGGEFIPNDLSLGETSPDGSNITSRVLLLSGPNMGGKSTLLRQTCLIAILAQIGCFVPAKECALTPIDRIFTRLGASDRILQGQSTFFVELAETASALRGATRRSLVIMDELGRGTSTFDGTAIASACVNHLVERNRCLTLFATHYHSVLDEWKDEPTVRLGHMECLVEERDPDGVDNDNEEVEEPKDHNITFLYTLGDGACPKSFGINVARLAGLPEELLANAKRISSSFEAELTGMHDENGANGASATYTERIKSAVERCEFEALEKLWRKLRESDDDRNWST
jgi:DNA mismatch repair protein MSH6